MQNIDGTLYKTNKIYRDSVDKMIAAENKRMKIQAEFKRQSALRQAEEARRRTEMNALCGRLHSYANQYITPCCQAQWRSYLSTSAGKLPANLCAYPEQQKATRRSIHLAASTAAYIIKRQSPVASVILDGFGLMTSDNLLDAAMSAADTICNMNVPDGKNRGKHTDGEASHQPKELTEA